MAQLTRLKILRHGKTESQENVPVRLRLLEPCEFLIVVEDAHAFIDRSTALDIARFIIEHAEEEDD